MPTFDSLLEVWTPTHEVILRAQGEALSGAGTGVLDGLDGEQGMVFASDQSGLPILGAYSAKPHNDPDFEPWTILWILQASGHELFVADHTPTGYGETTRIPRKRPTTSTLLEVGQMVLFLGHKTHWMPPSPDGSCMIAGTFEFRQRPTHDEAEATVAAAITRWEASKAARPAI